MRLFKRENGIYYVQISRTKKISLRTKDSNTAKALFRRLKKEYLQGKILLLEERIQRIPISQFKDIYIEYGEARKRQPTVRMDSLALRRLKDVIGDIHISAIKAREVDTFISILRSQNVKPISINVYLRHLKAAWNKAIEWNYAKENPFKTKPLKIGRRIPTFLEEKEVRQLLDSIDDPNFKLMVAFYVLTGARRSEVLNLNWDDIDVKRGTVIYRGITSKGHKDEVIPLHSEILNMLESFPKRAIGRVFKQYHPDTVSKKLKKALKKAQIKKDLRLHDLRHTFASLLALQGTNTKTLQELLRHSDPRMVEVYTHLTLNHLRKAINSININFAPKKHPEG